MVFEIRTAEPADAAGIAGVWAAAMPYLVQTARAIEAGLRTNPNRVVLIAEAGSEIVGYGNVYLPEPGEESPRIRITVLVSPAYRRQGIGSALADRIEAAAAAAGAASLLIVVSDDEPSRQFSAARGYTLGRELSHSAAELSGVPDAPPVPAGLRVADFDAVEPHAIWAALAATADDDPSGLSDAPPYEDWLASEWEHPELRRDLSIAVLEGDAVLAFTTTTADPERRVTWSASTGSIPAARGRGLAKLVKAVALGRARDAGLLTAFTGNDANNKPMLAVNEWLGYRIAGKAWTAEKTL